MDKTALMRAFKAMCAETSTRMSEQCKLSAAPLLGLKPIDIREAHIRSQQLAKEVCYEGRVLHAIICASARVGKRLILCLVEAEDEGGSGFLHVFNALKSSSRTDDAEAMFPRDARVAIKEPLCYRSIIHVSSPASVEFLGLAKKLRRRSVADLLKEGNRLLAKQNFVLAELYYTECIDLFQARDKGSFGEMEKEVFANRAECRLKLGKFEDAVMDSEAALKIGSQQHQVRSLWTKGRSLISLQEHKSALKCLESALELASVSQELVDDTTRCKTFLRQSQFGEFDTSKYFLGGMDSNLLPECSDFFGPLEMKMTSDGRGRGLFLMQDVRVGDLLITCNPTAAISIATNQEEADEDLYVELVKACIQSDKRLKQLYAMADSPEMSSLPDLSAFKCNVGRVFPRPGNRVVDIDRIGRVRDRVGYIYQSGDSYVPGLWASVGLINHSCLPNASKIGIGDVVFVRAAKNLRAGDEVLLSYLEPPLAPLAGYREKAIKQYNFECQCKRCKLERDNRDILGDLPYKSDGSLAININDNVTEIVYDIEKRIKGMSEEEKNWIRAGFVDHYSAVCMLKDPRVPSSIEMVRILHETAPGSKHTLSRIAFICNLSGRSSEALEILDEEVAGIYGRQSQEVVDAILRKYRIPSRSKASQA